MFHSPDKDVLPLKLQVEMMLLLQFQKDTLKWIVLHLLLILLPPLKVSKHLARVKMLQLSVNKCQDASVFSLLMRNSHQKLEKLLLNMRTIEF